MNIIETNLEFKDMSTRKSTERIILHHADAKSCSAEDIHRWHLNNGWSGAGYHFLVRKDGTIYRVRPEDKVGAHAYGANYDSLGICFEGDYKEEIMQEEEIKAGRELVNFLKNKYGINTVQVHKNVNATNCPGDNFPFDQIANSNETGVSKPSQEKGKIATIQTSLNEKYGLNISVDIIYFSAVPALKASPTFSPRRIYALLNGSKVIGAAFATSTFPFSSRTLSSTLTFTISPISRQVSLS